MDLYKISCAIDNEADVAAALSELMWVLNISRESESGGEIRIDLLKKAFNLLKML